MKELPLSVYLLSLSPFAAFTKKQRDYIKERDNNKCQAPFKHQEDTEHPLQVHHILPQGYCAAVGIENPDFPENGITLCRTAHEVIHPDVPTARFEYHEDSGSFGKLRENRHQKLEKREIYWNSKYDRPMSAIAVRNTQAYEKYARWPERRGND